MSQQTTFSLLAVGVAGLRPRTSALDIYTASTVREAIATIRLVCFDLVVVDLDNPKLDVWELMHRVLAAWPHQRWILASPEITNDEEVHARSLGALVVLSEVPEETWLADFAASLRRRDLSRNVFTLPAASTLEPWIHGKRMPVETS